MKKNYLFGLLAAAMSVMSLASCSDSNDDPQNPNVDPDETADLDYTQANAASWGNYMVQVGSLLESDAKSLYDSWTVSYAGGEPFATRFKKHATSDYPSLSSCLQEIVEYCANIANEVGTAKIGDPYTLYFTDRRKALYAVESWYSWHSRDDYTNNILSIRNSYYGSLDGSVNAASIAALMAKVNPTLDTKVRDAISSAADAIQAIPQPFRNNIQSRESQAAMTACATLEDLLSHSLAPALNGLSGHDAELQAIVDNYVDHVVLPTYAALKDGNAALHAAVKTFGANPSDKEFENACRAWLNAREPWEKSEAFLFGPVDALGLDPNMDSWPLDQASIINILSSGRFDNLNWSDGDSDDAIEAKQAVRGFHTLEFLLFKDGNPRKVSK